MNYAISLCHVEPSYLAAVRATVTKQTLGPTIRQILAESLVYKFIKEAGIQKAGHNVMIYRTDQQKMYGDPSTEFELEVGVQVAGPFESAGQVICSSTPGGRAITTLHTGHYDRLGQAHSAIVQWARQQGIPFTGLNWEVYGDWEEDPNKLTTEVFYLLK